MVVGGKQKHPRKQGKGQGQHKSAQNTQPKPKHIPKVQEQIERDYDLKSSDEESEIEDGTRTVNLVIDNRTGLMDDDFQVTIEVEALLKLKSSGEVDFFDTVKFQEGVGKLPAWCVSGIDLNEVHETEKTVFEVQKKMEKFKKKRNSFDEFVFFKSKTDKVDGNPENEQNGQNEQNGRNEETVEQLENPENLENLKNLQNLQNPEKTDSIDDLEDWLDDVL